MAYRHAAFQTLYDLPKLFYVRPLAYVICGKFARNIPMRIRTYSWGWQTTYTNVLDVQLYP